MGKSSQRRSYLILEKKKTFWSIYTWSLSKDQAFLVCIFCANQARKNRKWTEKNAFYTKKVKKTNLSNRNFPKELVYEFCLKIVLFLICVFWPNQARKHRFLIHWIEKNTFKTRKEKLQKSPQNQTFPKGLNHAFC